MVSVLADLPPNMDNGNRNYTERYEHNIDPVIGKLLLLKDNIV